MTVQEQAYTAHDIFKQAEGFFQTLDHIHTKATKETFGAMLVPVGVLSAFACELMLKCIVIIETGSSPKIHGLFDLFERLRPSTQNSLSDAWAQVQIQRGDILDKIDASLGYKRPRDLLSNLKSGNDAFVQLRYLYEGGRDFDFRLSDFPIVLREQIRAMKPEWFS